MRVLSFALDYDSGADPVADAFGANPNASARSLACAVTPDHCWRVDRIVGPDGSLDRVQAAVEDHGHAADCLGASDCETDHRTAVLHRDPTSRILFTSWAKTDRCSSVPHLALSHLGPGVLFATERRGRRYEWRVLMPSGANLGPLYDALRDACGEGVGLDLRQVTDESAWLSAYTGRPALPYAHYETLREAVERGYYETPREITVEELADELDVPRSTLSYRLRRAEAELATEFVRRER
ncbi:helix-turn-helix domain-containing protein [Halorussus amylolyticus]|uniref:helix-turn-helix domain-containing protein n=1 Tax=Halorussus amylolyticus TaxID=1126242 RepID=UPI00104C2242|nr:helix-turn-helix domain-containing protein [Halorussus amylolyticus]